MKFSIFSSAKAQQGSECTRERYLEVACSDQLLRLCNDIAAEPDAERRGELKKQLPVVTWQAFFPGRRVNGEAQPSGLFMLDIDHVDRPGALFADKVARRIRELGILYVGCTASCHGLRIVARCRPELHSIEECQRWLATALDVEFDGVCKDWARCSFLVHDSYTYFMDSKAIWQEIPDPATIYSDHPQPAEAAQEADTTSDIIPPASYLFKELPLQDIARQWLAATGGDPVEGERNTRLHALAYELRYITDFNEATLLAVLPSFGLSTDEMRTLIHSACQAPRSKTLPKTLEAVLQKMQGADTDDDLDLGTLPETLAPVAPPDLPPLIREIAAIAPPDFRTAVILCSLPVLGTLASKLRAQYLDGHLHSPSFQVSLEAPQASGKSFMSRLAENLLSPLLARDDEERQREQQYNERIAELKVTGVKVTPENRDELLGQRPKGIIRCVPATISITKLLMRLDNARGLHLFAVAEEIDTVTKAFKRGFSSYGDLLRVAFDNGRYGQDYASDTSFSGIVNVYYNTLFSGTPKAMRRFYPDVEDGLVSRVCFVQLPDQFGKPMPLWGQLSEKARAVVDLQKERLDRVSVVDNAVQPDHILELPFLNRALDRWLRQQQEEALRTADRTRDIFCRRAAVVGFRAGMLAWFLYGEKDTPVYRRRTIDFARWIATQMLNQHLLRFQIEGTGSNTNRWEEAYNLLHDEFSRDELQQALRATGSNSPAKTVVYRWKLLGCIDVLEEKPTPSGNNIQAVRFKKTKPW